MDENNILKLLGKTTEEMYRSLEKTQKNELQEQIITYHKIADKKINVLLGKFPSKMGETITEQYKKIKLQQNEFNNLKIDISSKYKIYLRGCGNAGKSTLLNALLSIDENTGSKMGKKPTTFTIDTYTDELASNKAILRMIDEQGTCNEKHVSKDIAIKIKQDEEKAFNSSKDKCMEMIKHRIKDVYLEQEREDIATDIYKQHLLRTSIRETKWGIEKNNFFRNCILIDTPGLSQELRFTNVIEDIKNYEVDGIIWVINTEAIERTDIKEAYKKEIEELDEVYKNKTVIAVINMFRNEENDKEETNGEDNRLIYGTKTWNKIEKKAQRLFCGVYGFKDIICVNAGLAYDGNRDGDNKKIDQSNIKALRSKINHMFVEKSTNEHMQLKANKVSSFLDGLYHEVDQKCISDLDKKIKLYESINAKIINQQNACNTNFEKLKNSIFNNYMSKIRNRIDENIQYISQLDLKSDSKRQEFIEKKIIQTEILEKRIFKLVEEEKENIFNKFNMLHQNCVVSNLKTKEYAIQSLKKNIGDFSIIKDKYPIIISAPTGFGTDIMKFITSLWGTDSIMTSISKGIRDFFSNPKDRAYSEINKEINKWKNQINIENIINEYANECYKTLNESMEMSCGTYDDTKKLHSFMHEFINDKPKMVWKKVGLNEIIGGMKNEF